MQTQYYKEKLQKIDTFIFDYDGVMTDGTVHVLPDGDAMRITHVRDGYIIQLLVRLGYRIAIISGGYSLSMKKRIEMLGIKDVFLSVSNKLEVYEKYVKDNNLSKEQVLYIGDDIPDYEVLKEVGLSACPNDAAIEIKEMVDYISPVPGGKGCIRDIAEQVLKMHDNWMKPIGFHW